jgi:alpha-aminoadipate carrier protein LysW
MSLDCRFTRRVYNTLVGGSWDFKLHRLKIESEDGDVLRCPECSAEIDVDEDEVEEGEILSCPECECELEVSQTHPVALNPISDELDEEEDDEDEDKEDAEDDDDEFDENGDLLEDEDDEDDAEDEDE